MKGFSTSLCYWVCISCVVGVILSTVLAAPTPLQWVKVSDERIKFLTASGGVLTGVFHYRVRTSLNQGYTWRAVSPVFPDSIYPADLDKFGVNWYSAFRDRGIYSASSSDTVWRPVNSGLPTGSDVFSIAAAGPLLIAGTNHGMYSLDDTTWANANGDGIPNFFGNNPHSTITIVRINVSGTTSFLATNFGGSYRGTLEPEGYKWTLQELLRYPKSLAAKGTYLFVASIGAFGPEGFPHRVARSVDNGLTWVGSDSGLPSRSRTVSLIAMGNSLFAGLNDDDNVGTANVWRSEDDGNSWFPEAKGLPAGLVLTKLIASGSTLFATTVSNGLWKLPDAAVEGVKVSRTKRTTQVTHPLSGIRLTGKRIQQPAKGSHRP